MSALPFSISSCLRSESPFPGCRNDSANGGTEHAGIYLHVAVIFRHVERQDNACADDGCLVRVSALVLDGLAGFALELQGRYHRLEPAAAFYQKGASGRPGRGLVRARIKGILREFGIFVNVGGFVHKFRLSGDKEEGRVFPFSVPGAVYREDGNVVVALVIAAHHRQAGEIKEVDASAHAHGIVGLHVDAGQLFNVIVVLVDVLIAVYQGIAQTFNGVYILLGEFPGEIDVQGARAVVGGEPVGRLELGSSSSSSYT